MPPKRFRPAWRTMLAASLTAAVFASIVDLTYTQLEAGAFQIAAYAFSDGAGATTADASGNGIVGTLFGATWAAGKNGGGLAFNGTSSYVDLGAPALVQNTGSLTV